MRKKATIQCTITCGYLLWSHFKAFLAVLLTAKWTMCNVVYKHLCSIIVDHNMCKHHSVITKCVWGAILPWLKGVGLAQLSDQLGCPTHPITQMWIRAYTGVDTLPTVQSQASFGHRQADCRLNVDITFRMSRDILKEISRCCLGTFYCYLVLIPCHVRPYMEIKW